MSERRRVPLCTLLCFARLVPLRRLLLAARACACSHAEPRSAHFPANRVLSLPLLRSLALALFSILSLRPSKRHSHVHIVRAHAGLVFALQLCGLVPDLRPLARSFVLRSLVFCWLPLPFCSRCIPERENEQGHQEAVVVLSPSQEVGPREEVRRPRQDRNVRLVPMHTRTHTRTHAHAHPHPLTHTHVPHAALSLFAPRSFVAPRSFFTPRSFFAPRSFFTPRSFFAPHSLLARLTLFLRAFPLLTPSLPPFWVTLQRQLFHCEEMQGPRDGQAVRAQDH